MTKHNLCSGAGSGIHDYPNVKESGGEVGRKASLCKLRFPVDKKLGTRCLGSLGRSSTSSSSQLAQEEIDRKLLPLPISLPSVVGLASKNTNHERLLVDCNIEYASEEENKATSFKFCEHSGNDHMECYSLEGFGGKRRHGKKPTAKVVSSIGSFQGMTRLMPDSIMTSIGETWRIVTACGRRSLAAVGKWRRVTQLRRERHIISSLTHRLQGRRLL